MQPPPTPPPQSQSQTIIPRDGSRCEDYRVGGSIQLGSTSEVVVGADAHVRRRQGMTFDLERSAVKNAALARLTPDVAVRSHRREGYGLTVTITTPCDATVAENFPVNVPKSLCAHRSRTAALR